MPILKPRAEDYCENGSIALLREAGEIAEESSREVRSASGRLTRMILATMAAPALIYAAYLPVSRGEPALAAAVPLAIMTLGWWLYVRPEWSRHKRRLAERRQRIDQYEDTAELRARLLAADAAGREGAA